MKDVFPTLDGYETMTEFMQKRCLLEYIMFKHIIKKNFEPTIEEIINEASISSRDNNLSLLFQSVAQNKAIFISHQDLFNRNMFSSTIHLNCFLSSDPFIVNLMLKRGGIEDVYSFEHITSEQCETILGEINEKISQMKKIIQG